MHRRHHKGPHDDLRMPQWMRRWIYGVGLASALSGLVWLLLHNFFSVEGEFGPQPHPFERSAIVAHGAAAVAAAWVLGLIWMGHVRRGIAFGRKLPSGFGLVALVAFLMLSGWGLYYLGDESLRAWTATAHWVVGLGAVLLLLLHRKRHRAAPPEGT
jgi:hypothetical protein